jgi:hypothetical protein
MSEQMGDAFTYMTQDMQGKLQNYMVSLEARYGDPAAYAAQRAEMAREQAAVVHADVRTREQALSAAYAKNRQSCAHARLTSAKFAPSVAGLALLASYSLTAISSRPSNTCR